MTISGKFRRIPGRHKSEQGYILLTLMLFVALLAITATAVTPMITFQIRRDREEELVHRGTQYSRAVRRYFKKFGRFPTRLEELENTNNMRFLRKRYKDPVTGQDFKVLHLNEVKLNFGPGIGVNPPGVPTLGGAALQNPGAAMQNPALVAAAAGVLANTQTNVNLNAPQAPADNSSSSSTPAQGSAGNAPSSGNPGSPGNPSAGGPFSGPTFGGGPIVGVVSTSEKDTIREFNKKNHYNQWQFIYDPGSDRGGLLNTPAQPPLQNAVQTLQSGAPGQPATQGIQGQPAQIQPAPK